MTVIEHIFDVLKRITVDGSSFSLAIRSSFKNEKKKNDPELLNTITSVCGGFLRHYYSLMESIDSRFPSLDSESKQLIGVILSDKLFSKTIDTKPLKEDLFKKHPEQQIEFESFIDSFDNPNQLIGENIKYGTDEYIHLRYNLPMFLVKMWQKNCKYPLSTKLFKSFKKGENQTLRVDTNKISVEEFLSKYSDASSLDDGFVLLKSNKPIRKLEPVINEDALNMHPGYSFALQGLDIDFIRGVAVYSETESDVLDELYARYSSEIKLDYLVGETRHFFEVNNKKKKYGLSKVSLYECGHDVIRTCLSKPVHTFIISPRNSCFQRLFEESDYFLRVKQDDLDEFIAIQNETLINASQLVEDDGYILYLVPTLCRNETYALIRNFVKEHPEFVLENEKQLFPFDKYQSLLYFAILKKESKHD